MDNFALTETWLTEKDVATKLEIIPTETHKFVQQDQQGRRRGGTGLLYKKKMDVKRSSQESELHSSFQSGESLMRHLGIR